MMMKKHVVDCIHKHTSHTTHNPTHSHAMEVKLPTLQATYNKRSKTLDNSY